MTLFDLIKQGGLTLIPLGICSIMVVAVALERLWTYSHLNKLPADLLQRVKDLLRSGQWKQATASLAEMDNPYARIASASLQYEDASPEEISDTLSMACDAEVDRATRTLPIVGTIGNIAPFIGLLGTVLGIMSAFREVAKQNAAGTSVVSAGISEALIATAAGLAVGIIAVIINNWCLSWVERYRLDLERFSTEWSYRLEDARKAQKAG